MRFSRYVRWDDHTRTMRDHEAARSVDRRFGSEGEPTFDKRPTFGRDSFHHGLPEHLDGTFFSEWESDCEARSKAALTPERVHLANFMLRAWLDAELEQECGCWSKGKRERHAAFTCVAEWIADSDRELSFDFVCEQLGLDRVRVLTAFQARLDGPKVKSRPRGELKLVASGGTVCQ